MNVRRSPFFYQLLVITAVVYSLATAQFPAYGAEWPERGDPIKTEPTENSGWPEQGDLPTSDNPVLSTQPQLSSLSGCQLSYSGASAHSFRLENSTGNRELDRLMTAEIRVLRRAFGVSPGFAIFHDGVKPNALATPHRLVTNAADGTVLFGFGLLRSEFAVVANNLMYGESVIGIMAHEWAHIAQFKRGMNVGNPLQELHADWLAGWYLGAKAAYSNYPFQIQLMFNSLYKKGDYMFNEPSHHGTPKQRVKAAMDGFNFALETREADIEVAFESGLARL